MHEVSPSVRAAVTSRGVEGIRWLAGVHDLVESLLRDWNLSVVAPLEGSSSSWVARVVDVAGNRGVLRVTAHLQQFDRVIAALTSASGRGYVKVLRADVTRGAVLLEELGSPLAGRSLPDILPIATATLSEAWTMPIDVAAPVDETSHKAVTLVTILDELGHLAPETAPTFTIARDYAFELLAAADPARQVVVHGDPHAANLLAVREPRDGAPAGYVYIDADLFRCEPEYDLGVLLRGGMPAGPGVIGSGGDGSRLGGSGRFVDPPGRRRHLEVGVPGALHHRGLPDPPWVASEGRAFPAVGDAVGSAITSLTS